MNSVATNNRRIATNTLMLYIRMFLVMGVSLFTTRIILDVLGVVDYGIYNVVGGIVVMFSFLSNTMASASQRFFSFELGRNDLVKLKKTFSTTLIIYSIIIIIILILSETVGLWFLNHKMEIPLERIRAANWVYQFSIIAFMFTVISIPYNALIVAHEKMNVYAYISIVEVLLKLVVAYVLYLLVYDKLILYSVLLACTTLIVSLLFIVFCHKRYEESHFNFSFDKAIFRILLGYSGWNLFGALSGVALNQGINILLNIFFGPVVNAARGIAYQLSNAVNQFVMSFFKAIQPQITKYYAAGEKENMFQLVFRGSKYSFFLLLFISLPLMYSAKYILALWLNEVPDYTVVFTRLVIVNVLIDCLSYPLQTSAQATGKIKKYQAVVGGTLLLNIPISYVFLKFGFVPQTTMIVSIFISLVCLVLRLVMLRNMIDFPVVQFLKKTILPVVMVSLSTIVVLLIVNIQPDSMSLFIGASLLCVLISTTLIYFLGTNSDEKKTFYRLLIKLKR